MSEKGQNPDLFLRQIFESEREQSRRGKLKIFFGYAAGIGKTYAMLSSAHRVQDAGMDVVCGYIEPHSRPETVALTEGLEMLPARETLYRDTVLKEFNLEEALKRKPELILVDELAHTNALGSRHEKRYQDIQELLNAGIDVYTTVNVQHLESQKDVIADITGIAVGERIPDSIFDGADEAELIDMEPAELRLRLKEGKVYQGAQADRAMNHFFTKENLVSLREIALRRMADRVNLSQNAAADAGNETAEHILICLSPSPSNEKVIRQAARMAGAFHGTFTALYVETPDASDMTKEDLDALSVNTRLAEQMGAKVVTSYGTDVVEETAAYAKVARVSKVVLGRTYAKRRMFFIKDSFFEQLGRLVPSLEIFLIPDAYDKGYHLKRKKKKRQTVDKKRVGADILICVLSLTVSTLIAYLFTRLGFSDANLVMVYILGVLTVSLFTSRQIWGLVTSILSVLVFNFLFTEPIRTLSVNDPGYLITFFVMFVTALISSALTKKVKDYARQNARKAYRTEILLETSRKLQDAGTLALIAQKTAEQLGMLLERNIYFFLGRPGASNPPVVYETDHKKAGVLDDSELAVAQWTYRNNKHAGFSTRTLPGCRCLFTAVRNSQKVFAVVGIDMEKKEIPAFEEGIMGAILNECTFAIEKAELIMERKEADIKLQNEQLRANLLRSISHDLRTPLTSISGNAQTLLGNGTHISGDQRQLIYRDIYDDSQWLINLVENLLSVTRIENGTIELNIQGEIVEDVVDEALRHVNRREKDQHFHVECEELLMARMDVKLLIQVLINLADNAVKYTPPGSDIWIKAVKNNSKAVISVADNGPGIPDEEKEKLFRMFYTLNHSVADGRRGLGLGLTLCQSIIRAHGSEIYVRDCTPHGTIFQFELEAEEITL